MGEVATPSPAVSGVNASAAPGPGAMLVVDLCGTIVRDNTTHAFVRAAGLAGWRGACARALASRAGLSLGHLLPQGVHRALLCACLRGASRERLRASAARYCAAALDARARRSVLAEIEAARRAGTPVVLASASLDVVVEAFAARLGAAGFVASELAWDADGICLGGIARDATGRKLARLRERYGLLPSRLRVVTDNPEDADLLGAASDARFVRADDD